MTFAFSRFLAPLYYIDTIKNNFGPIQNIFPVFRVFIKLRSVTKVPLVLLDRWGPFWRYLHDNYFFWMHFDIGTIFCVKFQNSASGNCISSDRKSGKMNTLRNFLLLSYFQNTFIHWNLNRIIWGSFIISKYLNKSFIPTFQWKYKTWLSLRPNLHKSRSYVILQILMMLLLIHLSSTK